MIITEAFPVSSSSVLFYRKLILLYLHEVRNELQKLAGASWAGETEKGRGDASLTECEGVFCNLQVCNQLFKQVKHVLHVQQIMK